MELRYDSQLVVRVGVAEHTVGRAPSRMMTMALGSCLGIVLYERESSIGALAHVMHPRRALVKNNSNRSKFVDTAIELIVSKMVRMGAKRSGIVAKIFGGAKMFDSIAKGGGVLQIGDENISAAREVLKEFGIPIVAECVGGSNGRTILFDLRDGSVVVKDAFDNEEIY